MRRRFLQTHKKGGENLTLVSLEDNNEIYLTVHAGMAIGEVEMRVNGDSKWGPNGTVILNKGDFVEYRGTISRILEGSNRMGTFVISKKVDLYGDCTSILKDRMLFSGSLAYLFENTPVVNVHSTFLPAITLADMCYQGMFNGCTSLITAPELPATTLACMCYDNMFAGCTSLTVAPELPATTLIRECYRHMFEYCKKLNYIKMLATDISASRCLYGWVFGVSSTGTFVKNPAMTTLPTGSSGIPSGWTVVNDGEE